MGFYTKNIIKYCTNDTFFEIESATLLFWENNDSIMKKILILGSLCLSLAACATPENAVDLTPKLGAPNPASQHCVEQGGRLEIKNEANGQVGYCHLADGTEIEEWELFHKQEKECNPEEAKKLVGQSQIDTDEILKKTNSANARIVAPNQAVTMDLRNDRITIVVDPATNKVIRASCG